MITDFLDIVGDRDKLQKELVFYSLFLMVFENFVSHWKETTRSFFSNGFATDDQTGEQIDFVKQIIIDGKILHVKDKEKEKEYNKRVFQLVKRNGKNCPKLSLFKWLADSKFIDDEDFDILEKCYAQRNDYAHSIGKCLSHYVTQEEKTLLKSLIEISEKAAKNWIYKVELPITCTPEELAAFVDEEGNYNPPEDVISGTQIFHSLVLNNLKDIFNE